MLGRLHSVLRDPYLRTFGTIASFSTLLSHWSGGSSFPLRKSTYSGKLFLLSSGICLGDLTVFVLEKILQLLMVYNPEFMLIKTENASESEPL